MEGRFRQIVEEIASHARSCSFTPQIVEEIGEFAIAVDIEADRRARARSFHA